MVEQYTDNVKVGGSNPPRLTLQPTAAIIIALILGLESFASEHEVFDTIYYYRGAAAKGPDQGLVISATKRVIF